MKLRIIAGLLALAFGALSLGRAVEASAPWSAQGGTGNALLTSTPVQVSGRAYLVSIALWNPNLVDEYCQFFDLPATSVTLGTTVPNFSIRIQAGNGTSPSAWEEKFTGDAKVGFINAITVACTTTPNGNTAPTTGIQANLVIQ